MQGQTELFNRTNKASYYNTTNLTGDALKTRQAKANGQTAKILELFANNPNIDFTPCEVQAIFPQWPITSIRRAITNLTEDNYLVKTDKQRKGAYGNLNYTWKFKVR